LEVLITADDNTFGTERGFFKSRTMIVIGLLSTVAIKFVDIDCDDDFFLRRFGMMNDKCDYNDVIMKSREYANLKIIESELFAEKLILGS
jgi:hypothetical protein